MNKKIKILLINTQLVELYISGFTNRFMGLWCYLEKNRKSESPVVHLLTNKTLWEKIFKKEKPPSNVTVISAKLRFFKYKDRLFYPLYILYIFYSKRCTSVHVATSIIPPLYLVRLFNFFKIPYCFTFANNSLESASYNSERVRERWEKLFSLAKNIDVLNPTNSINKFRAQKFVSPTSFPYLTEINTIPDEKFLNKNRSNLIVFCGSFIAQKNPIFAIEGFYSFLKHLLKDPIDYQLVLIGRGELLPEILKKIESINKEFNKEVICLEQESNLIEILSRAKIFLSLQDYDNYPSQSLMEGMIFCNSIISINNGDTPKLVDPLKNNILLEDKDPVQLGLAIQRLLADWQLNIANRQHILTDFSVEKFAQYFFQLHSGLN